MESTTIQIEESSRHLSLSFLIFITLATLSIVIVSVLFILLIFLFPIFVFIRIKNREWDKETSIYPITNHFFKAICWFYLFFAIFVIDLFTEGPPLWNKKMHGILFTALLTIFMTTICHTHHIILSFLALQRFIIYFFPSSEKYLFSKIPKGTFKFGYTAVLIIILFLVYRALVESVGAEELFVYYIILHSFLFFFTALYIPIFVSIRKLQNLASAMKNKQHKYILNQTITLITFKTNQSYKFSVVMRLFFFSFQTHFIMFLTLPGSFKPFDGIYNLIIFDLLSTPLTIQISYLLYNKRTTGRRNPTLSNIYRAIFKRNSVEPYVRREVGVATVVPTT
ncbi:Protein CBG22633 [Caenorhabditis briggsae]|uniref:Protein CBG22633 n=2 Tax=Caenorhabditis briggsae TaxID=6238 RepID=A8Y2R0_CAEBR|nr:Protein CBG22633 [Caenorhabditis briggsae]CAP39185.1 Protein CBG22633 [Caenorhabditis briggsae]